MDRMDVYYMPTEIEYRRQRAARSAVRGRRWPRIREALTRDRVRA